MNQEYARSVFQARRIVRYGASSGRSSEVILWVLNKLISGNFLWVNFPICNYVVAQVVACPAIREILLVNPYSLELALCLSKWLPIDGEYFYNSFRLPTKEREENAKNYKNTHSQLDRK